MMRTLTLGDCAGLCNTNELLHSLLPDNDALYKYAINWHTTELPRSATNRTTDRHNWYTSENNTSVLQLDFRAWEKIIGNDDLLAARQFLASEKVFVKKDDTFISILDEPLLLCLVKYPNRHFYNKITFLHLARVQSKEMMTLLLQPSNFPPGYRGHFEDKPIYVYKLADHDDRPRLLDIFNAMGISVEKLAMMILFHNTIEGDEMWVFVRAFREDVIDLEDDPVWRTLNTSAILCQYLDWNWDLASCDYLKPFHRMATGYLPQDKRRVMQSFQSQFLKQSLQVRNISACDYKTKISQTVLQIVYNSEPLDTDLLAILDIFKHNEVEFLE